MPRLVKGGKWAYGWVVIGSEGEVTIPPQAWREFGFQGSKVAVCSPLVDPAQASDLVYLQASRVLV